ncbi:MAG: hypothetical protein IPP73_04915 [Chitinophagaceae bacterium]|nr:hypothetical protein [Chitinophagaceae bacterium]
MNRSAGRSRLGRFYSEINEKYPGNEEWQFAYAGFLYNELITHPESYSLQFKIINNLGDVEAMENSLNRPLGEGELMIVSPVQTLSGCIQTGWQISDWIQVSAVKLQTG